MTPQIGLQTAPFLGLCLCIGVAIFHYQTVNNRIWQMVQARQSSVKEGARSSIVASATEVSKKATSASPGGTLTGTHAPPGGGKPPGASPAEKLSAGNDGWSFFGISPPVGSDLRDVQRGTAELSPASMGLPQMAIAVPPQMAIGNKDSPPDDRNRPSHFGGTTGENRNASATDLQEIPQDTTGRSPYVSSSECAQSQQCGPPQADSAGPGNADLDLPALVPIERPFPSSKKSLEPRRSQSFEDLPVHSAVASLVAQPTTSDDLSLPLVEIVKNRCFSAPRPERLPPVDQTVSDLNPLTPAEWTPSLPLYPSTGR